MIFLNILVPRTGVEPVISWMRTMCPGPLDERGLLSGNPDGILRRDPDENYHREIIPN